MYGWELVGFAVWMGVQRMAYTCRLHSVPVTVKFPVERWSREGERDNTYGACSVFTLLVADRTVFTLLGFDREVIENLSPFHCSHFGILQYQMAGLFKT